MPNLDEKQRVDFSYWLKMAENITDYPRRDHANVVALVRKQWAQIEATVNREVEPIEVRLPDYRGFTRKTLLGL